MASIHRVHEGEGNRPALVMVHGLGDSASACWRHPSLSTEDYWPNWLGRDTRCDVWLVDYNAALTAWAGEAPPLPDQAVEIADLLNSEPGLDRRQLLLVGHSLGGLVIKTMLIDGVGLGNPKARDVARRVLGVSFIATPHSGSGLASVGRAVQFFIRGNENLGNLARHDAYLRRLSTQFRSHFSSGGLRACAYAETKKTPISSSLWGLRSLKVMVVDASSADPGLVDEPPTTIGEADHRSICKPLSNAAQIHKSLVKFINDVANNAAKKNADAQPVVLKAEPGVASTTIDNGLMHARQANEVCRLSEPDTDDQIHLTAALCAALRARTHSEGAEAAVRSPDQPVPTHAPPLLNQGDTALRDSLRRLGDPDRLNLLEVRGLAHLALRRWAVHGRQFGGIPIGGEGQVHHHFVNLKLQRAGAIGAPFRSLEQLLSHPDVSGLDAVLIEGEPGAGKTWLLMRHEQALCEQIIAAHGNLVPWPEGTHQAQRPVLPLYLPLRELPADADPVDWCRARLRQQFPEMRPALDLLFDDAWRPWQLRLMLDGLNEVQVHAASGVEQSARRGDRVTEVVLALKRALRPELTMVLGSRPGHAWTFSDGSGELSCAQAQAKRWNRAQIKLYVEQRWAARPGWPSQFMALLPEASDGGEVPHEERLLLGVPLFLNMQCELWEAGARHLMHKRSQLLASLLWLRLQAAHDRGRDKAQHAAAPGMVDHTELQAARDFRAALGGQPTLALPPPFPNRGMLLQGLFELAKRQWLHHAHDGQPAEVRGQVALDLRIVREVLHGLITRRLPKGIGIAARKVEIETQLQRWLAAVQDLGIGQLHAPGMAGTVAGSFAFSHQVIGEWLASQALFHTGVDVRRLQPYEEPQPRHWHARALQTLRQELSPPPQLRDAGAELRFQRDQAAAEWTQVPQALVDHWLTKGIALEEAEVAADLASAREQSVLQGTNLLDTYQRKDFGFLSVRPTACGPQWIWHLDAFGNFLESRDALPANTLGQHWAARRDLLAFVCTDSGVLPAYRTKMQADVAHALGGTDAARRLAARLWQQQGRLQMPPPGPLDDILPLALDGLSDATPWWHWLAEIARPAQGIDAPHGSSATEVNIPTATWAVFSRCLAQLKPTAQPPHTPSAARAASATAQSPAMDAVWAASARHLLEVVLDFRGHDVRQRIQAGLLLGRQGELGTPQGDHLRYERVAQGVRLRRHELLRGRSQWALCGGDGLQYRLSLGGANRTLGSPQIFVRFEVAAYPVTVGEFMAFITHPGALDVDADWWMAASQEARDWLRSRGELRSLPSALEDEDFNNPLQPVTNVSAFVADAYAQWAQQVLYADAPGFAGDGLRVALLTEWQLEAAVRGPWRPDSDDGEFRPGTYWPGHRHGAEPDPMLFNHVNTGWGRPTPVGCFGGSTTAAGLADVAGNVWTWCANSFYHQGQRLRALRGGGFSAPAARCAAGVRGGYAPVRDLDYGFRLGRVVVAE